MNNFKKICLAGLLALTITSEGEAVVLKPGSGGSREESEDNSKFVDLNNDGIKDFWYGQYRREKGGGIFRHEKYCLMVAYGEGNLNFKNPEERYCFERKPSSIRLVDIDNDNLRDILYVDYYGNSQYIYFSKGKNDGSFENPKKILNLGRSKVY